jgi:hypothetical protein
MTDTSSCVWRTAYVSAIFEKEPVRLALRIAEARAAITERLNSNVEIGSLEHEAIEAALQGLMNLKPRHVAIVTSAPIVGETPALI